MAAKIKKGDDVVVIAGKYKNKEGKVTKIFPKTSRVLISGVAMVKKHQKQTAQSEGGIVTKEAPINISNIALKDPKDGKPTKVMFQIKDGKKLRVAKRSGEVING